MAYANSYTAATTDAFKKRVEMAVCRKAMTELGSPSSQADFDFAARDIELGRQVALKVLATAVADRESAGRLRREASIIAGLEHPGIVPVHDVGSLPDGRVFYAMKLVSGQRLDVFLRATQVSDGRVYAAQREVFVPPDERFLNVEAQPASATVKPGRKGSLELRVTDAAGRPVAGSFSVAVTDRAVEAIQGAVRPRHPRLLLR